eukprot:6197781-Pleurochrysis_carterae.AAC.1
MAPSSAGSTMVCSFFCSLGPKSVDICPIVLMAAQRTRGCGSPNFVTIVLTIISRFFAICASQPSPDCARVGLVLARWKRQLWEPILLWKTEACVRAHRQRAYVNACARPSAAPPLDLPPPKDATLLFLAHVFQKPEQRAKGQQRGPRDVTARWSSRTILSAVR